MIGAAALAGVAVLALGLYLPRGCAQPAPADTLPPPRPVTEGQPPSHAGDEMAVPISLPLALRLAVTNNLDIAMAREFVERTQAWRERARFLILPNASAGGIYVDHDGRIQQAVGNILNTNRNSLFVGGGPTLSWAVAEVLFAPLAARQVVKASEAGLDRVTNDTLLAVADTYFAILRARRRYARVVETLDFLTSDQPSASRSKSKGLLPLVRDIVEVGGRDAFRSDLERVRVEVLRRQEEGVVALQEYRVAAAELSRLLRLDPTIPLCPIEDFRYPVPLPGEMYFHQDLEELAAFALNNRPELAENQALVQAALARVRLAKFRPLLPQVSLTYSAGAFGGGPNFTAREPGTGLGVNRQLGPSGVIQNFNGRTDFEVNIGFRVLNMGFGNQAEVREQKAIYEEAILRGLQIHDRVVTQVTQAWEQIRYGDQRLELTRSALFDERGAPNGPVYLSLRLNFDRIRGAEGRPLEVQDSIRGLNDILEQHANSLTDFDRARFRLLIALGLPPSVLTTPVAGCPPSEPGSDGSKPNPEP
jgi:outer membrane protein TolC